MVINFRYIKIPTIEKEELFKRTVGENTDIVTKQMFSFTDKKGRNLVLRPEGTAGVVRHHIDKKYNEIKLNGNILYTTNFEYPVHNTMEELKYFECDFESIDRFYYLFLLKINNFDYITNSHVEKYITPIGSQITNSLFEWHTNNININSTISYLLLYRFS